QSAAPALQFPCDRRKGDPAPGTGESLFPPHILPMQPAMHQFLRLQRQLPDEKILKTEVTRRVIRHLRADFQITQPVSIAKQIENRRAPQLWFNSNGEVAQPEAPDRRGGSQTETSRELQHRDLTPIRQLICQAPRQ